jgi:hypothetical protein
MPRKPCHFFSFFSFPSFCCLLYIFSFFCSFARIACAAQPIEPDNAQSIEAVVVHVDEYAVYAPNLVFYFDAQMDKRKIDTLKRTANQFRNRKALISYRLSEDSGADKRMLLSDIAAASNRADREKPGREAAKEPADSQPAPAVNPPEDKTQVARIDAEGPEEPVRRPAVRDGGEPAGPSRASVAPDAAAPEESARFEPITNDEVSAFIRRLLYLNDRKDLDGAAAFYADRVDYYDRGVISRDKVIKDIRYYFRNWTQIETRMDGDVMVAGFEPEVRIAKFICYFSVRNDKKSIVGKSENVWTIKRIDRELKLIDIKQKILSSH